MTKSGHGKAGSRLPLFAALSHAVSAVPDMARGAGLVLVLATALMIGSGFTSGMLSNVAGAAALACGLAGFGATTRIGLYGLEGARMVGLRPGGFQLRRLEARLLGATLLIMLFMSIILSLLGLTALALFGGAGLNAAAIKAGDWARVGASWKLVLLSGVALVVVATPVLLAARLSLFAQATAAWGRMIALQATGLTNGAMIPLVVGLTTCALPTLAWAGLAVTGALPGSVASVVGAIVVMMVQTPLMAGFLGAAWRRLGHEEG